ncbi:MAG: hypothetical protein AB7G06_07070 [Bdellovibrionales bacterium]
MIVALTLISIAGTASAGANVLRCANRIKSDTPFGAGLEQAGNAVVGFIAGILVSTTTISAARAFQPAESKENLCSGYKSQITCMNMK